MSDTLFSLDFGSFFGNGLELVSICFGEFMAEFIVIRNVPGTEYISTFVDNLQRTRQGYSLQDNT